MLHKNVILTFIFINLFIVMVTSSCQSIAGLITFESNAAGNTPVDNEVIQLSDVFTIDGVDVRFGFDSNNNGIVNKEAVFERADNTDVDNKTGFLGKLGRDTAARGFETQLGDFFIRQAKSYRSFGIFTILYDSVDPVTAASGEIWDIDGRIGKTERFLVEAYNVDDLVGYMTSPLGKDSTLDAKPWSFGFNGLSDITKIEISFIGQKTKGIGLAFNNFSPIRNVSLSTSVPEPSTISLFSLLLSLFIVKKLRWVRKDTKLRVEELP
jgi:hypothetical protein